MAVIITTFMWGWKVEVYTPSPSPNSHTSLDPRLIPYNDIQEICLDWPTSDSSPIYLYYKLVLSNLPKTLTFKVSLFKSLNQQLINSIPNCSSLTRGLDIWLNVWLNNKEIGRKTEILYPLNRLQDHVKTCPSDYKERKDKN